MRTILQSGVQVVYSFELATLLPGLGTESWLEFLQNRVPPDWDKFKLLVDWLGKGPVLLLRDKQGTVPEFFPVVFLDWFENQIRFLLGSEEPGKIKMIVQRARGNSYFSLPERQSCKPIY